MHQRAVFLDRDGTINEEVHHLSRVEQFRLLPNVAEAVRLLNDAQFQVIVITNQSVVARGIVSEDTLTEIHRHMLIQLEDQDAKVNAIYYCPHHPTAGNGIFTTNCDCRKPQPGMLFQAAEDLDIALNKSFMVGDKLGDLESGRAAGCRTVLVLTGYGAETEKQMIDNGHLPDKIAPDLLEAAKWILQQTA